MDTHTCVRMYAYMYTCKYSYTHSCKCVYLGLKRVAMS